MIDEHTHTNSHRHRWGKFPFIRNIEQGKRLCLYCLLNRGPGDRHHIDSEWHAMFACALGARARRRFCLALESSSHSISFSEIWGPSAPRKRRTPTVLDLVNLVMQCRSQSSLVGGLARFADEVTARRLSFHRKLSVRDIPEDVFYAARHGCFPPAPAL